MPHIPIAVCKRSNLELPSQITQWLFAFDPAGMATARALALLRCQPEEQKKAFEKSKGVGTDRPFSRAVFLDAVRLWPTMPFILRELIENYNISGQEIKNMAGVIILTPFFNSDSERLEVPEMSTSMWMDKEASPSNGLVSFSAGPPICPAHNLVAMVSNLAICGLVSRASVTLVEPKTDAGGLPGTLDDFCAR